MCCFWCLTRLCVLFWYLYVACFSWKGTLKIKSLLSVLFYVVIITIIIIIISITINCISWPPTGQWNCSVGHWPDFKGHFAHICDMEPDCLHGEDEHDCPYNQTSCPPTDFSAGSRCFRLVFPNSTISWLQAEGVCRWAGDYSMAALHSPRDWEDMERRLIKLRVHYAYLGLRENKYLPKM